MRAPLTVIKGHLSLLAEGAYGKLDKKTEEAINKILDSVQRLSDTVNDFLDVSRIEQGKMQYNYKLVNIRDVLNSVFDELKYSANNKGLKFKFELCENLPKNLRVYIDEPKIRHVIFNLTENAIKYTKKGFVELHLCIKDNYCLIQVSDSGVGIPKEDLKKLFNKFTRSKDVYGINVEGSGLGLFIAREIIHAHNGHIWAESDGKGKGSKFTILLPVSSK